MMKSFDSAFASFEIASIAYGYRALAAITGGNGPENGIRILDASPAGARFLILALGDGEALKKAVHNARTSLDGLDPAYWIDAEISVLKDRSVPEALFALQQVELEESLVIVESATVSACLAAAQTLTAGHGLKAIEIRVQRASTGGAYGFFTGLKDACATGAVDIEAKARAALRDVRVEVINDPPAAFRSFFQFTG